ncbi:hypothetical protein BP5796_02714 [Coleophoma crateriformis]|uniref:Heterokaryon incompatibility domain-containing protein n=1 Tax=Coleophoma crateriformis TaxID=565419 RepID=A0A3D8SZ69_9HELO|nr:hypothetical protein BP5796_02714 [Coleophoma crateriformis]
MRLINTKSLELSEFTAEKSPAWAILSHTWEAGEISQAEWNEIQEQPNSDYLREKAGYIKIKKLCSLCQGGISICRHADCTDTVCELPESSNCCLKMDQICQCEPLVIEWAWVDTCCIDKSSSAELSEAINSMFNWYRSAAVCIAYLGDVPGDDDVAGESSAFRKSRWFTRGWTLQELIAPIGHGVNFYSVDWEFLGSTTFTQRLLNNRLANQGLAQQVPHIELQDQGELGDNLSEAESNGADTEVRLDGSQIEIGLNDQQTESEPNRNTLPQAPNKSQTQGPPGKRSDRHLTIFLHRLKPSRQQSQMKSNPTIARHPGGVPPASN